MLASLFVALLLHPFGVDGFLPSSSSHLHPLLQRSTNDHLNHTAISEFRLVNRRSLFDCLHPSPYIALHVTSGTIPDEAYLTVNVTGVLSPSKDHWVAMMTTSDANLSPCPANKALYLETGDTSNLPLLCDYPVKAQWVSNDPDYLNCKKEACQKYDQDGRTCLVSTCGASLSFHVVNFRTDVQFVFFSGGFVTPCVLKKSSPLSFATPNHPLYGHLSSIDSAATSMRLTWVSGDKEPQQVKYGNGNSQPSRVSTFTSDDMCDDILPSPAKDFGWHNPGYTHSAVMSGLQPSTSYSYRYGSDKVGWSDRLQFKTPPAEGSAELKFISFGDMGKAPLDGSVEHYIQPGSLSVIKAVADEVDAGNVDSIFHIGDISYATGFLVEWDFFLNLIKPVASRVPYMTAIGNHERDYVNSGSQYGTPDSGGECGGSIHFTVISTEHDWTENSEQYKWMKSDMASINRSRTPWLIFMGHRPMYTSSPGIFNVDDHFVKAVEPLLLENKVDLVLFGHVHNYERTCSVYQGECKAMPKKDASGIDVYNNSRYAAPVQVVIGMAGFSLDGFKNEVEDWSLVRISKFGYLKAHASSQELNLQYVNAKTRQEEDRFRITR
ncbi:hypothetical protein MLD38_011033 [Melastoma candidum]|uniref:Uncharacterized protein n=1 Tax=Melastoma candidum TaxID=119954 RepID=A0ACB9R1U3_9MYRT|nr:hypothetical protein MLD38_011033 [Melastoma candidum]